MKCSHGHTFDEHMKFCPECGENTSVSMPSNGDYETYKVPSGAKKKSFRKTKIALGIFIGLWIIGQFDSNSPDASGSTSAVSESTEPTSESKSSYSSTYSPFSKELGLIIVQVADNANAEDEVALKISCEEMSAKATEGLMLPKTGNADFDSAWSSAMKAGQKSGIYCQSGDYESAADQIVIMNSEITTATALLETLK